MVVAYALGMLESSALGPKIMYVNSYHADYEWSSEIIQSVLDYYKITRNIDGTLDCRHSPVELRLHHMDTKRNPEEAFAQSAAVKARDDIEAWNPDVVIVADDNAFKYLVMPYYKNAARPFVFCGINWDVSHYEDAPYKNTTGMIEVALFGPLLEHLSRYAAGDRVGFLSGDRYSDRAEAEYGRQRLHLDFAKEYYVTSFEEWKRAFRNLQQEVDLIIWTAIAGIEDWNQEEALQLLREEAVVPYGGVNSWMMPYELLGVTKSPEEQGEWAAQAALDIIGGISPMEIPIVTNQQAQIHLNMKMAKQMDIKFPLEWIENAHLVSAEQQKILFINSYHKGYAWSDDQEKGLLKALNIKENADGTYNVSRSPVDFRVVRMNAKLNRSEPQNQRAAQSALHMIEEWQPDLIIAADDCAAEYVVVPHLKHRDLPVVFCGVNCDAAGYGFPAPHITGMLEVAPYSETVKLLRAYAGGERVGLIGGRFTSCPKEVEFAKENLKLQDEDIRLVGDFEEWKEEYLALQQAVDMVILLSPVGIDGWDPPEAIAFIMEHTTVPMGGASDADVQYALLGRVKIAEEQGWWAGKTALKILDGTPPSAIPMTTNQHSSLYLNMELAEKMGIHFPVELLKEAIFVGETATE
jgi:ABC-type uncharacterized transport system substrate-binding protein